MPVSFTSLRYEIMFKCWQDSPTQRPTFEELVQEFDAMLVSLSDKVRVYITPHNPFPFISVSVSSGFVSKCLSCLFYSQ